HNWDTTADLHSSLYQLSGGHSSLHKAAFMAVKQHGPGILAQLRELRSIRDECRKIWESLSPDEQDWLRSRAKQSPHSARNITNVQETKDLLSIKGIINRDDSFFSPIFQEYVSTIKDYEHALEFDPYNGEILIFGEPLDNSLTPTEFKLFEMLYSQAGLAVPNEDIIGHVWEDASQYTPEDGKKNLRTTIYRLRRKIEPNPARPRFILNPNSVTGYILKID
ncbi:MAG: winged helix-turn-helix domain-containing protein, partial [Chloroflexota bacterium]